MNTQSRDARELLTPIAAKLREGRSVIRPVSQVTLRLKPVPGVDRFAATVDEILRWINRRAGKALPAVAWQRQSFELSAIGSQRAAGVALQDPKYWAARLDDADKNVPQRTWITEIGVGIDPSGDILFGARLICTTRGADEAFERSIPGFVRTVISSGPAELDGVALRQELKVLSSDDDVANLVTLLEDPTRQSNVIVLALPEGSSDPGDAAASAVELHSKLLGVAHVFALTSRASFALTDSVGRELSVFHEAVRTYRPGFRAWIDQPSNHPFALPNRIASWDESGPPSFERWMVNQSLASSVSGAHREESLPAFNTVRQIAAYAERSKLRSAGGSDAELARLYEQDNEQLRKELKEQKEQYDGLLSTADIERDLAVNAANAAKAQALERLHRIRLLEARLAEGDESQSTPIPETLDTFAEWCREHLVGSVEITNRAYQGVRKSEYHEPAFIYRTLLLLRDHYVPMRIQATPGQREAYAEALAQLQLEESATGDGVKYAADLYSVQYGGTRRPLDRHLKGSDSRDRRFGFRLYFFWDEDEQVVVVGWLPSHLDNRAS
ncbi:hypothetical protein HNP48_002719 [Acidovorax soli]|uniref:Uncharacterized protein n=1 Tax=Acidovorax soli TaxID=592050 RepID=A0A7X0PEF3_9BURK|nr:hypothetical protein [Acidovorax soli]MBB6560047.1 hypothetical protein [Acidovorax soli]